MFCVAQASLTAWRRSLVLRVPSFLLPPRRRSNVTLDASRPGLAALLFAAHGHCRQNMTLATLELAVRAFLSRIHTKGPCLLSDLPACNIPRTRRDTMGFFQKTLSSLQSANGLR